MAVELFLQHEALMSCFTELFWQTDTLTNNTLRHCWAIDRATDNCITCWAHRFCWSVVHLAQAVCVAFFSCFFTKLLIYQAIRSLEVWEAKHSAIKFHHHQDSIIESSTQIYTYLYVIRSLHINTCLSAYLCSVSLVWNCHVTCFFTACHLLNHISVDILWRFLAQRAAQSQRARSAMPPGGLYRWKDMENIWRTCRESC